MMIGLVTFLSAILSFLGLVASLYMKPAKKGE